MSAPFIAQQFTFIQPDGSELWVKGWGTQERAFFECLNGYTVVLDPQTGYYVYAKLNEDGSQLLPTEIQPRVSEVKPGELGIAKGLRTNAEAEKRKSRGHAESPRGKARWEERSEEFKRSRRSAAKMAAQGMAAMAPTRQTVGDFTGLVLLIQFPDVPGTIARTEVEAFCNQVGYRGYNNNGSVYDYFHDISGGKLRYKNVVTNYYTAKHPRAYYTDPDLEFSSRAQELIREALDHYITVHGFDAEKFSFDGRNYLYAISAFYAGHTVNNWAKGLWPHRGWLRNEGAFPLDDEHYAYDYQITDMGSELSLGTFCHENGHMLCDFADLYPYSNQQPSGVGEYCLMCSGGTIDKKNPAHVNPYLKYRAGWYNSITTLSHGQTYAAKAGTNDFFIYPKNGTDWTEYFIIENRSNTARDAILPAAGLSIWHIDETGDNTGWIKDVNFECKLMQADGRDDLDFFKKNDGDATDIYKAGGVDQFNGGGYPNSRWYDGTPSGLSISEISEPGAEMTFKVAIEFKAYIRQMDPHKHYLRPEHSKNIASDPSLPVCKAGDVIVGDMFWTATMRMHGEEWIMPNQQEGDLWLHATQVNGVALKKSCWLAIIHKGETLAGLE